MGIDTTERRRPHHRTPRRVGAAIVALALTAALGACGSSEGASGSDPTANGADATTTEPTTSADTTKCATAEGGEPVLDFEEQPTAGVEPGDQVTVTFETDFGDVVVELDTERTPATADNFAALARNCYFDGNQIFRTEAQSGILQSGSPHTQDNTDPGPGYTIEDEGLPFTADDYGPGTLAMANTGQPNSGSAQFFFLATEGGRYLGDQSAIGPSAGSYAVFGRTVEGIDVLERIAALDDGTGAPRTPVAIDRVTVEIAS